MPGINITTASRGDAATPLPGASGQLFIVGLAERGPTDEAVLVRGLADFVSVFGARASYSHLYDSVRCYFEEGGVQAYVARVVGASATIGAITISDRSVDSLPTITVTATSAGTWSEDLSVVVADGSVADTVRITVLDKGDVVETYNNIDSIETLLKRFAGSPYVDITNAGSASVAPNNLPALGTYELTAGSDDRATVTPADHVEALDLFVEGYGDGAVAIPGLGAFVHEGLIDHASKNRRIAILSSDLDSSESELVAEASSLNSDAAGLFAPWVMVSDGAGGTRPIPPEGFVAGVRSRAHTTDGPHRAPAGEAGISNSVSGLYVEYPKDNANALDVAKVSIVRRVNNSIRLYGWRSLSNDVINFGYLHHRDVLNRIVVESESQLEQFVFAPIDSSGQTLSAVGATLVGILEPMKQSGALYARVVSGEEVDPGYQVETGDSINSTASLANNLIRAQVSIRVSPLGAMIDLLITKVGLTQAFS